VYPSSENKKENYKKPLRQHLGTDKGTNQWVTLSQMRQRLVPSLPLLFIYQLD